MASIALAKGKTRGARIPFPRKKSNMCRSPSVCVCGYSSVHEPLASRGPHLWRLDYTWTNIAVDEVMSRGVQIES